MARGTVSENDEYLTVHGGKAIAQGATVSFDASLHNIFDNWNFIVDARRPACNSSGWPRSRRICTLAGNPGAADHHSRLEQDLTGEGRVLADKITLGEQALTGLDTHFTITPGEITLERTSFGAAQGKVTGQLTYDFDGAHRGRDGTIRRSACRSSSRLMAPVAASAVQAARMAAVAAPWLRLSVETAGKLSGKVDFSGPVNHAGTASLTLTKATYLDNAVPDAQASARFDFATGTFARASNCSLQSARG